MRADDPAAVDVLRRCRVARIATRSPRGRPSINPLYFLRAGDQIWLGTPTWTLAARNVRADPRVTLLFEDERAGSDRPVLRIKGRARVRTDRAALRAYNLGVARRYMLTPGGLANLVAHARQLPLMRRYHAQSAAKGAAAVIEVTPEQAELLGSGGAGGAGGG